MFWRVEALHLLLNVVADAPLRKSGPCDAAIRSRRASISVDVSVHTGRASIVEEVAGSLHDDRAARLALRDGSERLEQSPVPARDSRIWTCWCWMRRRRVKCPWTRSKVSVAHRDACEVDRSDSPEACSVAGSPRKSSRLTRSRPVSATENGRRGPRSEWQRGHRCPRPRWPRRRGSRWYAWRLGAGPPRHGHRGEQASQGEPPRQAPHPTTARRTPSGWPPSSGDHPCRGSACRRRPGPG